MSRLSLKDVPTDDLLHKLNEQVPVTKSSKSKNKVRAISQDIDTRDWDRPSEYHTRLRAKLRDKIAFGFGYMPRFISEIFAAQAEQHGMGKKEYLYFLLREKGGDIPPYEDMDGRHL